jgi:hypothetical protein
MLSAALRTALADSCGFTTVASSPQFKTGRSIQRGWKVGGSSRLRMNLNVAMDGLGG